MRLVGHERRAAGAEPADANLVNAIGAQLAEFEQCLEPIGRKFDRADCLAAAIDVGPAIFGSRNPPVGFDRVVTGRSSWHHLVDFACVGHATS